MIIRIEFKLKNPQKVIIYGYDETLRKKEIGCIFNPALSGASEINCIQVCGIKEAFDFWGCARYKLPITDDNRKKVINSLKGIKTPLKQAKDIQLSFDDETCPTSWGGAGLNNCDGCFNQPCTCENKGNLTKLNPYNLKRGEEIPIIYDEDIKGDYEYKDGILMRI